MQSKWLRYGLATVGVILVLSIVFGAGIVVGRWSAGEARSNAPLLERGFLFSGSHGAIGTLQAVQEKSLTLELRDGTTQTILIDYKTRLERKQKKITLADLRTGERLLVVGTPDEQGQIKARLIHAFEPRNPSPTPTPR